MTARQSFASSHSSFENIEDIVTELQQKVQISLERLSHFTAVELPEEIPLHVKDRALHPSHASDSDWAVIYRHWFDSAGYAGLEGAVRERATQHMKDNSISPRENYAVMNADDAAAFMMILATMYPGFIKGLIDGDLFYRYAQDPELRKAFDQIHSLEKHPGNYVQARVLVDSFFNPATSPVSQMTQAANREKNPDSGKGLTFHQLYTLHGCAVKYLPSGPNVDLKMVMEIDAMYQPKHPPGGYKNGRYKYVQQGTNEHKFEAWLKALKALYIDRIVEIMRRDPDDPILHEPMRISLLEIGWGQDTKARASAHDQHTTSNTLYTFFQALIKYLFGSTPDQIPFDVQRLATNYLTRGDSIEDAYLDARLADVGLTMIGRTEWFNGGLNLAPGGGAGVKKSTLDGRLDWITDQAKKTYTTERSRFKRNILDDQDKITAFAELDKWTEQDISDGELDCENLQRQCQSEWEAIGADLAILEDVKLAYIAQQLVQPGQSGPLQIRHVGNPSTAEPIFGYDGAREQGVRGTSGNNGDDDRDDDEGTDEDDDDDDDEEEDEEENLSDILEGLAGMRLSGSLDRL